MKCKVIVAFGPYSKGAIIEPHAAWRQVLRARGFIEPVTEAPPVIERAVMPIETATVKTKRGRKRKA